MSLASYLLMRSSHLASPSGIGLAESMPNPRSFCPAPKSVVLRHGRWTEILPRGHHTEICRQQKSREFAHPTPPRSPSGIVGGAMTPKVLPSSNADTNHRAELSGILAR